LNYQILQAVRKPSGKLKTQHSAKRNSKNRGPFQTLPIEKLGEVGNQILEAESLP
jgi:hypothetical protein